MVKQHFGFVTSVWFVLIGLSHLPSSFADHEYVSTSHGNHSILVSWTLDNSENVHILKCIADGNPLPSLKWTDSDGQDFHDKDGIRADLSNKTGITLTFTQIGYKIIDEYNCVSTFPNGGGVGPNGNRTSFFVSVERAISGWVIFLALVLLAAFIILLVGLCKGLKLNSYSTLVET